MYDNDDGCGGCLTLFIIAAIFCWISDNWTTILLVIGAIIAIVAVIAGVKSYQAKAPEREAAWHQADRCRKAGSRGQQL